MLTHTEMQQVKASLANRMKSEGRTTVGHAKAMARPAGIGAVAYYADKYMQGPKGPLDFYRSKWWGPGATLGAAAMVVARKHPQYARDLAVLAGYKLAEGYDRSNASGYGDAGNVTWPAPPAAPATNASGMTPAEEMTGADAGTIQGSSEPVGAAPSFWAINDF